jgi:1-aminocyclopropane-1-carboxylate deaminase/D-cysteine desulfhydrase-like pyridoxal-dependent ACC family enzyme
LILVEPEPEYPSANLFLDQLLGANIVWAEKDRRDQTLNNLYRAAQDAGKKPYLIPYGGSNQVGAFAYLKALEELQKQLSNEMPDWIVFASSSGGTQAGMVYANLQHTLNLKILGISVDETEKDLQNKIQGILSSLDGIRGGEIKPAVNQILVNPDFRGEGYGVMNDQDKEAIHLFAEQEGILLDPVYTGRAGAGLIELVRSGFLKAGERVLFWHTGGTPALFAEQYLPKI